MDVQRVSDAPGVPDAASLRRWARAAAAAGTREMPDAPGVDEAEVTLRVVDAGEGAALNETYRGRRGATNVLSFPFEAPERTTPMLLGDVVVCAPVVAREAREQGKPLDAHFAHMVVHGVLHLLGFEHERAPDAKRMEALERHILERLGHADPYSSAQGDPP